MHEKYMRLCIDLARKGEGRVEPNPKVGAIIVNNGKIIGRGFHKKFGGPHAEINAIKNCKTSPRGGTLYVNLEPCCHFGKTPPCTKAIIEAGIKKVVYAMRDPNPRVCNKGSNALRKKRIEVISGYLEKEAKELNGNYIKWITKHIPYVTVKLAMSVNGMIAKKDGTPIHLTGKEWDTFSHELRNRNQAILVGINTVQNDNPKLTCRLKKGKGRNPLRVIVDSTLKTPRRANVVKDKNFLLVTTTHATPKKLSQWKKENIFVSGRKKEVNLKTLLQHLGKTGISSLLVEGGRKIIESFLSQKLVDEIFLCIASKQVKQGMAWSEPGKSIKLSSVQVFKKGQDVVIHGKPLE